MTKKQRFVFKFGQTRLVTIILRCSFENPKPQTWSPRLLKRRIYCGKPNKNILYNKITVLAKDENVIVIITLLHPTTETTNLQCRRDCSVLENVSKLNIRSSKEATAPGSKVSKDTITFRTCWNVTEMRKVALLGIGKLPFQAYLFASLLENPMEKLVHERSI